MRDRFVELSLFGDKEFRFGESMKTLRTNIRLDKRNVKKILVTSTAFGEGKSSISLEFAASMGSIGKKVLLMDADMRNSSFTKKYGKRTDVKGLAAYLNKKASLEEMISKTNVENVDFIYSGQPVSNSSELLDGDRFKNLMTLLDEKYDYIIVDTPPIGCVIDAAVVAANCDGIVFVIESEKLGWKAVKAAMHQLAKTECEILGVVLNKSKMTHWEKGKKNSLPSVRD